ncbi:coagulation factor X-like [Heliangelus exortis]|uniref:coagulation factor X-like n=1 Tax=Heliangelus exortis TaxID=472823 RepID=UPI003A8DE263
MAMIGHRGTVWLLSVVLLYLQMVQTVLPKACKVNNGNCEQFCKAEDEGAVCSCAAGYALGSDNKTCLPVGKKSHLKFILASCKYVLVLYLSSLSLQAVLIAEEDDDWFCGGTILNEYFVLSGASCVNLSKDLQVLVGMVDKEKEEPSRAVHRVEKIIAHAEFDTETFDSDIALLKLEEPITFSEDVVPACLPEEHFANDVLMNQTYGIVSGFGREYLGSRPVRRMKVLQIPYVDRDTCKLALRTPVTENMFCAGYDKDGKDACHGDGGGPHVTQYHGTYFITGIVSW